jgi:hypothetical protein
MTFDVPSVYVKTFVIAGIVIPICLHIANSKAMPWWPDTISMGLAFGIAGVVMVSRARADRAMKRRMWQALKNLTRNWHSN